MSEERLNPGPDPDPRESSPPKTGRPPTPPDTPPLPPIIPPLSGRGPRPRSALKITTNTDAPFSCVSRLSGSGLGFTTEKRVAEEKTLIGQFVSPLAAVRACAKIIEDDLDLPTGTLPRT